MKKIKSRYRRIRKQKVFKWGILIFLIVGVLGKVGFVEAGMNDSRVEKNRLDGVYAVTTLNGQQRIFYLNMYRMNERVAYCIELGVDIITDIYHSTGDFSASYLSSDQIDYIRSISYFGYQYLGHDDYRYYMAAQELIWEYLSNINIEWTNVLDVNGTRINIESYKAEILNLRRRYYNQASFDWIDGQKYSGGEKITLQDIALVLSDYEIASSGHSKVSIVGNTLNIEVSNDYIGMEEIILRKKPYYDYDSMLYYYDGSQKLISSGNYLEIVKKLYFFVVGKTMKVQVIDSNTGSNASMGQASLEGALYGLYNGDRELLGTYETNKDGTFEVNNLLYDTYYFKQIKSSEGYLLNEKEVQVDFLKDSNEIILEQQVISNVIEIRKVYGSDGKYFPEANISFQVLDWNDSVFDEVVTDRTGIVSIWLPYGDYTISQNNTTWGYSKVDNFKVQVQEAKDDKVIYNLVNDLLQYKVRINTFEQNSGKKLLEDGIIYRVKEKSKDDYMEVDGNILFVTNSGGSLILPMLFSYGDYILEQVDVPSGIFINSESLGFSIDGQTEFAMEGNELVVDVEVFNQLVMGKINVLANREVFSSSKNDYSYRKEPRVENKFLLIANRDIIVNGEMLYREGQELQEVITNEDGVAIVENLYLGDYCLIDLTTGKKECFLLESTSNDEKIVEKEIEITELLDKGDFSILNQDESRQGIEGSIFEVYEEDGNLIYTGVTNGDGVIQIKDLVHGTYCIEQKRVSNGWQLLSDKKCISLSGNKTVEFINQKQKNNKILVPNTFSTFPNWVVLVHIMGLIGMIVLVYKKIFIHH